MNTKFRNADLHTLTMQLEGMSNTNGSCKSVGVLQIESEVRTGDSQRPDTQKKNKRKMVTVV
jgi:hypothetical protein